MLNQNKRMDWKNQTDEGLVEDNDIGARGLNAQVEMMRRLKNSIEKLDKNTEHYSQKLVDLTVALFVVAIIQIAISLIPFSATVTNWIILFDVVVGVLYFVLRSIKKERAKSIEREKSIL